MQNTELIGFSLSPQQKRILALDATREAAPFLTQISLILEGDVDPRRLKQALDAVCARHEMLRTRFLPEPSHKTLLQVIVPVASLSLQVANGIMPELKFDLASGSLLQAVLVKITTDRYRLSLTAPSVCADARSLRIISEELVRAYSGSMDMDPGDGPVQYADVAEHFTSQLESGAVGRQYWHSRMVPLVAPNVSSNYTRRSKGDGFCPVRVQRRISMTTLAASRHFLGTRYPGDEAFLFACWQGHLRQLTGQADFVVGYAADGRSMTELEGCIGPMERYLPIRTSPSLQSSFSELLAATSDAVAEALSWQMFLQVPQETFLPVCFSYFDASWKLNGDGFSVVCESLTSCSDRFDLKLSCIVGESELAVDLWYDAATFPEHEALQFLSQYVAFVESASTSPDAPIGWLNSINVEERARLVHHLANGPILQFGDHEIVRQIEDWARRYPEAPAILSGQAHLTYRELDRHAGQLANELRSHDVGPDVCVALLLERSVEMVVGLLAILKAGGAYLPIDPAYPDERVRYILQDARPALVLTQEQHRPRLSEDVRIQLLDCWLADTKSGPVFQSDVSTIDSSLAYVIYTSGSTGKPKGVLVTQRGLSNYVGWAREAYQFRAEGCTPLYSSLGFDLTVTSLWPTLVSGGCVVVVPEKEGIEWLAMRHGARGEGAAGAGRDEKGNGSGGKQARYEVLKATPSHLRVLKEALGQGGGEIADRLVIGGEALRWEDLSYWSSQAAGTRVVNEYGPTETVVGSCVYEVGNEREAEGAVPIGRPIANTRVYVVDEWGNLAPGGAMGELYIGGEGVARGYLGQPGLTAERFVPDGLSGRKGERLYRTGDKVRWRSDGELEYLGRLDNQVKIRGYRIELGEIEAVLAGHERIREAAVVVREDTPNDPRLVAYFTVRSGGTSPNREELKQYLKSQLPDYMAPAAVVELSELPLTANGKLDWKALPRPETVVRRGRYVEPRTEAEQVFAGIWARILRLPRVGIEDNFFELGGDSILSIQIVSYAREAGYYVTVAQMFEYQTIGALAAHVEKGAAEAEISPVQYDEAPLTPIQQWFVDRESADLSVGNHAVFIKVPLQVTPQALESVLQKLVAQHDALQLRFVRHQDQTWRQCYSPGPADAQLLELVDLHEEPEATRQSRCEQVVSRIHEELDVEAGLVFRAAWFDFGQGDRRFLLAIHHLVVDAVSMRILVEDIQTMWQQWQQGGPLQLPPKTTSFLEWAKTLEYLAGSPFFQKELPYWERLLSSPVRPIRRDHVAGNNTVASRAYFQIQADVEDTQGLLRDTYRAYRTRVHEVVITALARAMARWNGSAGLLLDLEGHGRVDLGPQFHRDVSRTVGWFTTIYPVYLNLNGRHIGEDLKTVKEVLREVPNQGVGFGVLKDLDQTGRALLEAVPKPEVVFNYLGQFDQTMGSDEWTFAPRPESTTKGSDVLRPHLLEIQSYIVRGQLQIDFRYGKDIQNASTVQLLGSYLLEELHTVVQHCRTAESSFTPSDFPLSQLTQRELDEVQAAHKVVNLYPLSPMQQGMLFHSLQVPGAGFYVNQRCIDIEGALDEKAFRRAWAEGMQRHTVLRTSFSWQDVREPVQIVEAIDDLKWQDLDWRGETTADQERLLEAFLAADRKKDFDLTQGPLMRLALIKAGENHFRLIWTHHHILLDGWSVPLVLQDVLRLYVRFCSGEPVDDLPHPRPYSDYIEWLLRQDVQSAETFWRGYLRGYQRTTRLNIERTDTGDETSPDFARETKRLSPEVTAALESNKQRHHLTLNTMMQAAWGLVLQRYTGQQVVVFGATSSGRPAELPGADGMAGLFINTLPVRVGEIPGESLLDLLTKLQQQQLEARQFEYSSLVQIQGWSEIPHGQPLFDNIFVFENYPVDQTLSEGGNSVRVTGVRVEETTHYPLVAMGLPGQRVGLQLQYDRQKIASHKVKRLLEHWSCLLTRMTENLQTPASNLEMLSSAERRQITEIWNRTEWEYQSEKCIHECIEDQVLRTPEAVALVFEGCCLTYRELNEQSNQLAHYLRERGVNLESKVGLCLERSAAMAVAVLAVLKAGGAYVPLEPGYPVERLAYMLKDSQLQALLTERGFLDRLPETNAPVICLEEERDRIGRCPSDNPVGGVHGGNAAYMIYTSGSTGVPKGVVNTHAGIRNRILWMQETYGLNVHDHVLQKTPFSFDVSVWEFLWPLMSGARLVMARPEGHKNPRYLSEVIEQEEITVLHFVPSMLAEFLEEPTKGQSWKLRLVISSGEELPKKTVERFFTHKPGVQLHNLYGPTEAAVDVTFYACENHEPAAIPIGRPIANTQIYLLDSFGLPVPAGVTGELHIGGVGLARGYLNRPELTAEKFVPDPFTSKAGARLYRTGDLARWREDGNIEFLGRSDFQVKIRGHRIELGEIESAMRACAGVKESAVATRKDGHGSLRIVAYMVASVEPKQVQRELRVLLPEYMVPTVIMKLEQLPLTRNGKLDRKALPEFDGVNAGTIAQPSSEVEMQLAILFEDLLGVSPVGRDQNFFDLGGHSLLALALLRGVKQQFGQSVSLPAFLQGATIESLGAILRKDYRRSQLVPIQRRGTKKPLFFVHALGASPWLYADLARILARDDQPLFGFQALDDQEAELPSYLSIEERAATYLAELQQVQPEGPYLLGGYSFGGYVAYEMARQLQQQNQSVAGLFLLDLPANTPQEVTPAIDDAEYMLGYLKNNLALLSGNARIARGIIALDMETIPGANSEDRFRSVVNRLIQLQILAEEVDLDQVRNYILGARRREQALCDYILRPYAGTALLIRAEDNAAFARRSPDSDDGTLGWAVLCEGPVQLRWVPGQHKTFMLPPHVEKVAEALRSYLRSL